MSQEIQAVKENGRLVFVLNSLDVGGSESKIVRVANELARSGTRVEIAYLDAREALLSSVDPAVPVTFLRRRGKFSLSAVRRLHTVLNRHNSVAIAVNLYPLLYVFCAAKLISHTKVTTVALVNTAQVGDEASRLGRIYAPLLRRCDKLVFGCQSELRAWIDTFDLPEASSECIYNGVDEDHFSPNASAAEAESLRKLHGISEDAIVFGSIGRLAPRKAFDQAILAIARLHTQGRPCDLVLVGQGSEQNRLAAIAAQHKLADRVKFLGLLSDVRPALAMMDVFVLPSIEVETFSNAALEAMSMARPVALSQIGGAAEMLEHGRSGMLFRAGDLDALTDTLTQLYDSVETRRCLGRAARQRIIERFRFSEMVDRYRSLSAM